MHKQEPEFRPVAAWWHWLVLVVCPVWGGLKLWRSRRRLGVRLLGWVLALVWLVPWSVLMFLAAVAVTPLELEWDGGFPPIPTLHKTRPDYQGLEADRQRRRGVSPSAPTNSVPGQGIGYWAGFRGPRRDGVYREMPIHTNWARVQPRQMWRQPVGAGYASFAVAGGLAYTIEQRRTEEAIVAYEVLTGRELWASAYPAFFTESMGGDGPRATPAVEEGRVYSLGATGEFRCLDAATGQVLWGTNILAQHGATNLTWAQSASPLVLGDKVIVCPGGAGGRSVAAYDKRTGALSWTGGEGEAAYSSPVVLEVEGQPHLVVAVKNAVLGLVPEGPGAGRLLWEVPWVVQMNNRNIAQPVQFAPRRFLLSAGYGTGAAAFELEREGERWAARELWRNRRMTNKFCSSVLRDGFIYGLDEEVLACVDVNTGEQRWRDGRYGHGQVLLAGEHLVVLSVTGDLALVEARPEKFTEVARIPALKGKTWNHPAIAGGYLLVRNMVEMACYDLRPGAYP